VRLAFNKFTGMNAIVVMNSTSSEIVAAKSGSPLIIGRAPDGFYVSSDLASLASSKDFLFLKDNEMVVLGKSLKLLSISSGNPIEPVFEKISWKVEVEELGNFEYFMLKEIFEQPKVIRNIEKNYVDNVKQLSELVENAYGTFLIGSGTAYFACLAGSYLFSKITKKHVNTLPASEFNYLEDFLTDKSLIIALSQSGETIDVVEPLQRAKAKGSKIVALTNVIGSTIYRMADKKFLLLAGPEKAVASTKAYIAKLSILLMLAFSLNNNLEKGQAILEKTASEIEKILEVGNLNKVKKLAKILSTHENIYVIGRGVSYASSLEAALKIKEVSYIHAEGLAGGELKHGAIALISKGTPCIIFAPNDETYSAIISNAAEIKARGGYIIGISHEFNSVFDHFIEIGDIEEGSYIAQIIPAQLLAYYLALEKNYDPDKPRNLAKSVTVK
jgi:glucosamine--fructose-6-phosphate aminotransferase (isomerizing)